MSEMCERCKGGATGDTGHDALVFYVEGPYPGHQIYKCSECGERWIRHYGGMERFGWTRYALQFAGGIRTPITTPKRGLKLQS